MAQEEPSRESKLAWGAELDKRSVALARIIQEQIAQSDSDDMLFPSLELTHELAERAKCSHRQVCNYFLKLRGPARTYFILNKPRGVSSMRTPGSTVYSELPTGFPSLGHVGRLDKQSEGLMLFTDDGRLSNALIDGSIDSERSHVEKTYCVLVSGFRNIDDAIEVLRNPLVIPPLAGRSESTTIRAALRVVKLDNPPVQQDDSTRQQESIYWISIVINEGKKHQIRRLCASAGLRVHRLVRTSLGPIHLGDLKLSKARFLTSDEVFNCYLAAVLENPPSAEHINCHFASQGLLTTSLKLQ
jgi:pseudouridine synthase